MIASSKALMLIVFACGVIGVQCHEVLTEFLEFDYKSWKVHLSKTCENDLRTLREGIEGSEVWALKVRDASGRPTSGFMWGNSFWLGAERACFLLNHPPKINLVKSARRKMSENFTEIASEIPVEYRMFYAAHTSSVQFDADLFNKSILHIGLCFPKSCRQKEVDAMARTVIENKFHNNLLFGDLKYLSTKTLEIRKNFLSEPFVVLML
jgi:hypothetical protein